MDALTVTNSLPAGVLAKLIRKAMELSSNVWHALTVPLRHTAAQ